MKLRTLLKIWKENLYLNRLKLHNYVKDNYSWESEFLSLNNIYKSLLKNSIIYLGNIMKAVILAGGLGTRLSEETITKPKPMIEIGGKPILWHIMKIYSAHGINDFIICCGYKGYLIKEYFANYFLHMSDITFDMEHNEMTIHDKRAESWTR